MPPAHYSGSVNRRTILFGMVGLVPRLRAVELKRETEEAYDRYLKLTEAEMESRKPQDFLWIDSHRKEKTMVWLSQDIILPRETLDRGEKIDVPDGAIQHWFGAMYLETATLNRLRDTLLDFGNYKYFFGPQVIDSRLVKREDNVFSVFLRLNKKQITQVVLNVDLTATYKAVDATHATLNGHSTRIGESQHPGNKKSHDQEVPASEQNGYLWRLDNYWRFEVSDVGVYAELDQISLSRQTGTLHAGKYLNGFQSYPQELLARIFEAVHLGFPAPRK